MRRVSLTCSEQTGESEGLAGVDTTRPGLVRADPTRGPRVRPWPSLVAQFSPHQIAGAISSAHTSGSSKRALLLCAFSRQRGPAAFLFANGSTLTLSADSAERFTSAPAAVSFYSGTRTAPVPLTAAPPAPCANPSADDFAFPGHVFDE